MLLLLLSAGWGQPGDHGSFSGSDDGLASKMICGTLLIDKAAQAPLM